MSSQNEPSPRLESLPNELAQEIGSNIPPESLAALSLSCKTLELQVGKAYENLNAEDRKAFLRILEKDFELVYCPWCNKLHPPERSVPLTDNTSRFCHLQSTTWTLRNGNFPSQYHPNLLYAIGKYRRELRNETVLTNALKVDSQIIHHGAYSEEQNWRYNVNKLGVFVAKQQRLFTKNDSIQVISEPSCPHSRVTIRDFLSPNGPTVKLTTSDQFSLHSTGGPGEVQGCKQCNRCCRVDIKSKGSEGRPAEVLITTWYYLGLGKSPDDIAAHLRDPTYREFHEGNAFTRGEVAKHSQLFEELV